MGILVGFVIAAVYALRNARIKARIGNLLWKLPAIGERLKLYQLARFYRTIGMLLRGGTPLPTALRMGAELLHPLLRARLAMASRAVNEGRPVSEAMEANGLTTIIAQRMLAVGEKSGNMGEMMERIAEFHDEEISRWVDWFTRLFEPLLMAAIGLVIGAIVVLMYMPIFELAGGVERICHESPGRLGHRGELVAFLASHEETLRALDAVRAGATVVSEETRGIEDLSLKAISEESSEVVRLVRSTLRDALMIGASDIHMETIAAGLVIKFRIDGILSQIKFIQDTKQAEQAISRVKVLAELDITERRVPQDGRFKALDRGRAVDFRVSIMPNIYGEDAVLRVLDKQSLYESTQQQLSLDSLGFETGDIRALRRLSHEPYGMLLVTGPTGSGKTTTLYAAITEINNGQDKIVTIEDPVEYQLAGVLQ